MMGVSPKAVRWVVLGLAATVWLAVGQVPPLPPEPGESVPGKPGPGGNVQFDVPFISGITAFLVGSVRDCRTGEILSPEGVVAHFVFTDGANPPYKPEDLVLLSAEGYVPVALAEFTQLRVNIFVVQLVYVVPVQAGICLVPLKGEPCEHCSFRYEVGPKQRSSDGKTEVLVSIYHCNSGKWETIQSSYLEALPKKPEGPCKECTYRLQRETLTFNQPNGKQFQLVRNTIYHCQSDGVFKPVWYDIETVADKLPEGKCTPGKRLIVQTARLENGKRVDTETLYVCNDKGEWVALGSRQVK